MTSRIPVLLVLSFLALPLFAQAGDLSVHFGPESRISDTSYVWQVTLRWTGDEPARDVVLDIDAQGTVTGVNSRGTEMKCTRARPIRCTMPLLHRDEEYAGAGVVVRLDQPGTYHATASVSTSTPEASTENNTATHAVVQTGLPDMWGSLIPDDATVDPNGEGTMRLGINNSGAPATNIIVRAKIEDGGVILRAEPTQWGPYISTATCTIAGGELTCHIPAMRRPEFEMILLTYRAPDRREGGKVVATATVESDREDFQPADNAFRAEVILRRLIVVTSAEDDGTGTLRQAILEASAACYTGTPCSIGFTGVGVIQPRTPLPHARGALRIDGGPSRVVLDGSLLAAGDGLRFDGGCEFDVRNLEIRNFPGHGIETRRDTTVHQCHSIGGFGGLSVRRTVLSHNERGIVVKGAGASLKENFIYDQRRAGIFIDGSYYSQIFNNVVVNNGASGIFVNTAGETQFSIPPGADIVENIVHGNAEWGIVRTRNIGIVRMRRNSMVRNGLYGYDVGVDLGTPNRADDSIGIPNKPVLESAKYDPATNTTVIRGTSSRRGWVDVYASPSLSRYGHPEAESWLGETTLRLDRSFELRVPRDLRGQWITATTSVSHTLYFLRDDVKPATNVYRPPDGQDTSELSDAIQVE